MKNTLKGFDFLINEYNSKLRYFKEREINAIYNHLVRSNKIIQHTQVSYMLKNCSEKDEEIYELIAMDNNMIDYILELKNQHLLPQAFIDNINNELIIIHLLGLLKYENLELFNEAELHSNNIKEQLIYFLDNSIANTSFKLTYITNNLDNFEIYKPCDKHISWIKENDKLQIDWAFNYLLSKNFIFNPFNENITHNYKYSIVIYLIYLSAPNDFNKREILINQMKKSWSQRKYRAAEKVKTPYHLPLTKEAKKKLKFLSELNNFKENILLENLIDKEYKKYCDNNGRFKY